MKTLNTNPSVETLTIVASILRNMAKKKFLGLNSSFHWKEESFCEAICGWRYYLQFHGLTLQVETWFWNGEDCIDVQVQYAKDTFNPLQYGGTISLTKLILFLFNFKANNYHYLKDEIIEILYLTDEKAKIDNRFQKIGKELFNEITNKPKDIRLGKKKAKYFI